MHFHITFIYINYLILLTYVKQLWLKEQQEKQGGENIVSNSGFDVLMQARRRNEFYPVLRCVLR